MADKEEEISSVPPPLKSSKKISPEQTKTAMKMRTVSWKKNLKEEEISSNPPFLPFFWNKNWKEERVQKGLQLKTGRMKEKEGENETLLPQPP